MSEPRQIDINLEGRVGYRVTIRGSKAAMQRLGTCMIEYDLLVTSHFDHGRSFTLKVFADPDDIDDIEHDLKAQHIEYSGPTYFENGGIRHVYDSPEDELAENASDHYLRWKEKRKDERREHGLPGNKGELCRLLYRLATDPSSVEVSADEFAHWLAVNGWERVESAQKSSDDIGYLKDGERIWLTPGEQVQPRGLMTAAEVEGTSTRHIKLQLRAALESIDDIDGVPGG